MNEIERRLTEWARWLRSSPARGHCASLEHRYRSPQCWDEINPSNPISTLDAAEIEDIVVALPEKYKKLAKYHYVYRMAQHFICRRLRFRHAEYDNEMNSLRFQVQEALDKLKKYHKINKNHQGPHLMRDIPGC